MSNDFVILVWWLELDKARLARALPKTAPPLPSSPVQRENSPYGANTGTYSDRRTENHFWVILGQSFFPRANFESKHPRRGAALSSMIVRHDVIPLRRPTYKLGS